MLYNFEKNNWEYKNDIILAPMVRMGTLPMRLLSLKYGATMVYSPEYIDKCIIHCQRKISDENIIKYYAPSGKEIFSTVKDEPLAFQLGTSNAGLAVKAIDVVYQDIQAIDVNMGCPLPYSTKGGMGAALLKKPELIVDILKTLKRNFNKPVTCKIRLLDDIADSIKLVKIIESCNINALAIHSRYVADRSKKERARHDQSNIVIQHLSLPTIINGDIYTLDDAEDIKKKTGADSVMIARGAQYNPSIFRKEGFLPIYDVANDYLQIAEKINNPIRNTIYGIKSMTARILKDNNKIDIINKSRNYDQLNDYINKIKKNLTNDYIPSCKAYII
ncbi:Dihydrouridine synthase (Dus) [seawater metagenome]|uniref:Dihydrouridine synthase (Dus) n=1 Tax=seawater metagenome TaxID=1561972 RepID=A0A5E8CL78_9ZZZZ